MVELYLTRLWVCAVLLSQNSRDAALTLTGIHDILDEILTMQQDKADMQEI